jgi:hypothetical protein
MNEQFDRRPIVDSRTEDNSSVKTFVVDCTPPPNALTTFMILRQDRQVTKHYFAELRIGTSVLVDESQLQIAMKVLFKTFHGEHRIAARRKHARGLINF